MSFPPPGFPMNFDPSKMPPMPPGFDLSKMAIPPGMPLPPPPPGFPPMDLSHLPPMPPGFDPTKMPPLPGMPPNFPQGPPPPPLMGRGGGYGGPPGGGYQGRGGGGYGMDQMQQRGGGPPPRGGYYNNNGGAPPQFQGGPPMSSYRGGYNNGPPPRSNYHVQEIPYNQRPRQEHSYDRPPRQEGGHYPYRGGGGPPREQAPRDPTNTVWLCNTEPPQPPDTMLYEIFSRYGRIIKVGRLLDKGITFVHYETETEATNAVNALIQSRELGAEARISYGKHFSYNDEELQRTWRPRESRPPRGGPNRDSLLGSGDYQGGPPRDNYPRHHDQDNNDEGGPPSQFHQPAFQGAGIGYQRKRFREEPMEDRDRPPYERRRQFDGDTDQRPSRRPPTEATNVLYVGDLPLEVSTDDLRKNFAPFGNITTLNRPENKNLAFIHFETVEECSHAITIMRGVSINGYQLRINYGKEQAPRQPASGEGRGGRDGGAIPTHEIPTNVVWLGGLTPDVTEEELNPIFDQWEGFVDCRIIPDRDICFAHFDTIEHAKECRVAMHNYDKLRPGNVLRVSFGKNNHNKTLADRYDQRPGGTSGEGGGEKGSFQLDPITGAMVAVANSEDAMALLPMEAGQAALLQEQQALAAQPKYLTKSRPAPIINIDLRVKAIIGASYYRVGADRDRQLIPDRVNEICDAIDRFGMENTEGEEGTSTDGKKLLMEPKAFFEFIHPSAMFSLSHVLCIFAKRLHDHFQNDTHKKLLLFYTAAQFLFIHGQSIVIVDPMLQSLHASLEAFIVLTSIVAEKQNSEGLALIEKVLDSFQAQYFQQDGTKDFGINTDVVSSMWTQVLEKKKAASDFSSLLASIDVVLPTVEKKKE